MLPADLRDKPWAKDFAKADDPWGALGKAYEGAQSLIGKKPETQIQYTLPENATPEQVKQFRAAVGIPDTSEGYDVPTIDWGSDAEAKTIGELVASTRSDTFVNGLKAAALEAGIPAKAFSKLVEAHDKLFVESYKKVIADQNAAAATADQEFATLFNEKFGSDAKAAKQRVWKSLEATVPAEFQADIDSLSPRQMVALSLFAEGLNKQYGREDKINLRGQQNTSVQSLRDQRMVLLKEISAKSLRDPDYDRLKREIDELNRQMGELGR